MEHDAKPERRSLLGAFVRYFRNDAHMHVGAHLLDMHIE